MKMLPTQSGNTAGSIDSVLHNDRFIRHVGGGKHVPVWLDRDLAKQLYAEHGKAGRMILHPNINLKELHR
jgi:hypothetical protein